MLEKNLEVNLEGSVPQNILQGGAEMRPSTRKKPWHPPKGQAIDVAANTHINPGGSGADALTCHS